MVHRAANQRMLRGSPTVVEAFQGIEVLKVMTGRVDRSMGDVHPLGSPHYTLDPDNVVIVTANIAAGLTRMAPEQGRAFEANRQAFLEKVADADRRWKSALGRSAAPASSATTIAGRISTGRSGSSRPASSRIGLGFPRHRSTW